MTKILSTFLILFLLSSISFAQNKMSKDEILNYWNTNIKKQKDSTLSSYKLSQRKLAMPQKVNRFADSLLNINVDTIGIYKESYPGSYSTDDCDCEIIPWTAYMFWVSNKECFVKEILACCSKPDIKLENDLFFDFFLKHRPNLSREVIMPVIESAEKDENGNVVLSMILVDHTTNYYIFCKAGNDSINIHYDQAMLEDPKNLFLNDNIESKSNEWRLLIKNLLINAEK